MHKEHSIAPVNPGDFNRQIQRPKNIQQDIITENMLNESSPPTPFGWWMSPDISGQDPANTSSLEYRFAARL
jgi:hypothetical protein